MCEPMGRDRSSDRGQVTILVVLAMGIFLLAFIGFATDYTNFWFHRQAVQGAADASCQAAAMDLLLYAQGQSTPAVKFTPVNGASIDCASAPTAAPCIIAKKNGYDGTLAANKVVMSFPASVAGATAPPGIAVPYVQLDVTEQVRTYFSRLLSKKSTVGVHASATCGLGALAGPVPLVVLHPTASGALAISGSGGITIIGGSQRSVQVNSSSQSAVSVGTVNLSQAGPKNTGGDFAVFGGPATKPGSVNLGSTGDWIYPSTPLSDPYAQVAAPAQPGSPANGTNGKTAAYKLNGCPASSGCTEYSAGYYPSGISVKNKDAIFDPGLYYIVGGMTFGPNVTVRVSTANGDGSGGVVFYFKGTGTISVDANSGKQATSSAYYVNGSVSPQGVASRALQCPGGAAIPSQLPATVNGNILLGPCTGSFADPSGQNRGFVFFQDRSAAAQPLWGGGGQFLLAGFMYFHQCRADGTGSNCSVPGGGGYGTTFGMQGNACSGSYAVGSLITDAISLGGTPCINMILSPSKSFAQLKVVFLQ
jgi:hypothetical protein